MTLVVERLSFSYPSSRDWAVQCVDLSVRPGEVVLLTGPSGCGKSTLALALGGFIPHRVQGELDGAVSLDGTPLSSLPLHEVAGQVGMVFQDPASQLITPTVESEVAFGPENLALPHDELERRVAAALHVTGMSHRRHALTASLSGGEKQRVAIAAALAMEPRFLILDEPCSDLDPLGTQEILGVLRRLAREHGLGIVLVEHRIDEVASWVDRIALMDHGMVVLDRPTRDAFADPAPFVERGVAVPEVVRLAAALPHHFPGPVPLTVEEAAAGLRGTAVQRALAAGQPAAVAGTPSGTPAPEPVIEWQAVGLDHRTLRVLDEVTASVRHGEWVAVVGSNGSGKTSLVELPVGFRAPTRGRVLVHGAPVVAGRVSTQAHRVGYLFQAADTMLFARSVREELEFSVRHGLGRTAVADPAVQERITELLRLVGLEDRADAEPFQLSAGQRERLAIAALLVAAPDTLVLDEPTTGQDEAHARAIMDFLVDLRRQRGMSYVMVTHDMRVVARHASHVVVLDGGCVLTQGPPREVFAHPGLAAAHIVPPPMAALHRALVPGMATVCLDVEEFLSAARPARQEATA